MLFLDPVLSIQCCSAVANFIVIENNVMEYVKPGE